MKTNANYWKRIVALLCMGWVVIWVSRTMLAPVYGQIQETVGQQSSFKLGLISSMYFFGYTAIQIPGGILADRLGKKKVMIPGLAIYALGIFVIYAATSIEMIYAGNLMTGLGSGVYFSGAYSLTGDYVPKQYKFFATAFVNNGCAIGLMLGYLSSGFFVVRQGLSWKTIVLVVGILAIGVVAAFQTGMEKDEPKIKPGQKSSATLSTFFQPAKVTSYAFYFAACYGYYMIITWLPSFLENERGMTGGAASAYACIVAVVSIPSALFLSKILDKFASKRVILMASCQIISAAMLLGASNIPVMAVIMLCLATYGIFGKQVIDPLIVPHVSGDYAADCRTTGLGIFNFFGMSGSVLSPIITGKIEDITGSKIGGFYVAAALLVVTALLFFVTNRKTVK